MNGNSIPEKIKALKDLLDANAITQEEFDIQKKLLLETPEEKKQRELNEENERKYLRLSDELTQASDKVTFQKLAKNFTEILNYKDSEQKRNECNDRIKQFENEEFYLQAKPKLESKNLQDLIQGKELLAKAGGINDSDELMKEFTAKIAKASKKRKKTVATFFILIALIVGGYFGYQNVYVPYREFNGAYKEAYEFYKNGEYIKASKGFESISDYRDSEKLVEQSLQKYYDEAVQLLENKEYDDAAAIFSALYNNGIKFAEYTNCKDMNNEANYRKAVALFDDAQYEEAAKIFNSLEDYSESKSYYAETYNCIGDSYFEQKEYYLAYSAYKKGNKKREDIRNECLIILADEAYSNKNYELAIAYFQNATGSYKDKVEAKLWESKYQYVLNEKVTGKVYKDYLLELYNNTSYKSKVSSIYNKLFDWKASIVFTHPDSNKAYINKRLDFKITISGGDLETGTPYYYIYYPDGESWKGEDMDRTGCSKYWKNGISSRGTLRIKVFSPSGKLIGENSIYIN